MHLFHMVASDVTLGLEQMLHASSRHGQFNLTALKHFLFSVQRVGLGSINLGASLGLSYNESHEALSFTSCNVCSR